MASTYMGTGDSPHPSPVIQERREEWVRDFMDTDGLLTEVRNDDYLRKALEEMGESPVLPWDRRYPYRVGDRVVCDYWVNQGQERFVDEHGTIVAVESDDSHRIRVHLDSEVAARWMLTDVLKREEN